MFRVFLLTFHQAFNDKEKDISLVVNIGTAKLLRVCGDSVKESLKHATFFIEYNANISAYNTNGVDSQGSSSHSGGISERSEDEISLLLSGIVNRSVELKHRKYMGDECTELRPTEMGTHVLTVRTNANHPHRKTSLSHIIEFL